MLGKMRSYAIMALLALAMLATGCVPMETCRVVFFGNVTDASTEAGIEGVRISALEKSAYCVSDATGDFEMPLISAKPGKVTLTFEKEGYESITKVASVSQSGSIRMDASMFPGLEGRALVDFEFTITNDYTPGTFLGDYEVPSYPLSVAKGVAEAEGVVVYPGRGTSFVASANALSSMKVEIRESDPRMGYMLVSLPAGKDAETFSSELLGESWVDYAEPDYVCFPLGGYDPDDFLWPMQWGPRIVSMHRAWQEGFFGDPLIIAVVDTGVYSDHPDLSGRCLPLLNSINTDGNDNDGHGTHVAGTIGATLDNSVGIAGMNRGALILPVKALEKKGFITSGTMTSISRGIRLAADNGADVINMSIGWPLIFADFTFRLLKEALDYADSKGVALVAASGNDSSSTDLTMPAKYGKCFAVSSVGPFYFPPSYANTGLGTDIFGPGGGSGVQSIVSTVPYGKSEKGYARMSGTSMATPHVSAIIGALMSYGLTACEAESALLASAQYIEGQDAGLANAYAALAGARGGRAIFWLCDDAGNPVTYAFRGSDGSRDVTVFGDIQGHAWLCGWINLSGSEIPAHGDYFGMAEVFIEPTGPMEPPSMLKLNFVEGDEAGALRIGSVPKVRESK